MVPNMAMFEKNNFAAMDSPNLIAAILDFVQKWHFPRIFSRWHTYVFKESKIVIRTTFARNGHETLDIFSTINADSQR